MATSDPSASAPKGRGLLLLVDDEPVVRRLYRAVLEGDGYEVLEAAGIAEARAVLASEAAAGLDAVLLDVMMPGGSGIDLLHELKERSPALPVVMATASQAVVHAVAALRARAYDYLLKPVANDELRVVMRNAVERGQMHRELLVRRMLDPTTRVSSAAAVFASRPMQALLATIEQVKDSAIPVMILGESGTGKEVVARTIHERSRRSAGPFVAVNCAALPASLAESELFGHERGAFTGATQRRKGRFEEASGGTLFLDEVGELDVSVQAKLLRALQEREIVRVGGGTVAVDARVVVATHRDLVAEVRAGRFREDLYYRLDVLPLRVPPLRERTEEIPALAAHLVLRIAREEGLSPRELTPAALAALAQRVFRGNVRELQNVLRRSMLLSAGSRGSSAQPAPLDAGELVFSGTDEALALRAEPLVAPAPEPSEDVRPMREYERDIMLRALAQAEGRVSEAARLLGIGRTTFYRRAKRFAIPL